MQVHLKFQTYSRHTLMLPNSIRRIILNHKYKFDILIIYRVYQLTFAACHPSYIGTRFYFQSIYLTRNTISRPTGFKILHIDRQIIWQCRDNENYQKKKQFTIHPLIIATTFWTINSSSNKNHKFLILSQSEYANNLCHMSSCILFTFIEYKKIKNKK